MAYLQVKAATVVQISYHGNQRNILDTNQDLGLLHLHQDSSTDSDLFSVHSHQSFQFSNRTVDAMPARSDQRLFPDMGAFIDPEMIEIDTTFIPIVDIATYTNYLPDFWAQIFYDSIDDEIAGLETDQNYSTPAIVEFLPAPFSEGEPVSDLLESSTIFLSSNVRANRFSLIRTTKLLEADTTVLASKLFSADQVHSQECPIVANTRGAVNSSIEAINSVHIINIQTNTTAYDTNSSNLNTANLLPRNETANSAIDDKNISSMGNENNLFIDDMTKIYVDKSNFSLNDNIDLSVDDVSKFEDDKANLSLDGTTNSTLKKNNSPLDDSIKSSLDEKTNSSLYGKTNSSLDKNNSPLDDRIKSSLNEKTNLSLEKNNLSLCDKKNSSLDHANYSFENKTNSSLDNTKSSLGDNSHSSLNDKTNKHLENKTNSSLDNTKSSSDNKTNLSLDNTNSSLGDKTILSSDKKTNLSSDKKTILSLDNTNSSLGDKTNLSSDKKTSLSSVKKTNLSSDKKTILSLDNTNLSSDDKTNLSLGNTNSSLGDKTNLSSDKKTNLSSDKKTILSLDNTNLSSDDKINVSLGNTNSSLGDKTNLSSVKKTNLSSDKKTILSLDNTNSSSDDKTNLSLGNTNSSSGDKTNLSSDKKTNLSSDKKTILSLDNTNSSSDDKTNLSLGNTNSSLGDKTNLSSVKKTNLSSDKKTNLSLDNTNSLEKTCSSSDNKTNLSLDNTKSLEKTSSSLDDKANLSSDNTESSLDAKKGDKAYSSLDNKNTNSSSDYNAILTKDSNKSNSFLDTNLSVGPGALKAFTSIIDLETVNVSIDNDVAALDSNVKISILANNQPAIVQPNRPAIAQPNVLSSIDHSSRQYTFQHIHLPPPVTKESLVTFHHGIVNTLMGNFPGFKLGDDLEFLPLKVGYACKAKTLTQVKNTIYVCGFVRQIILNRSQTFWASITEYEEPFTAPVSPGLKIDKHLSSKQGPCTKDGKNTPTALSANMYPNPPPAQIRNNPSSLLTPPHLSSASHISGNIVRHVNQPSTDLPRPTCIHTPGLSYLLNGQAIFTDGHLTVVNGYAHSFEEDGDADNYYDVLRGRVQVTDFSVLVYGDEVILGEDADLFILAIDACLDDDHNPPAQLTGHKVFLSNQIHPSDPDVVTITNQHEQHFLDNRLTSSYTRRRYS